MLYNYTMPIEHDIEFGCFQRPLINILMLKIKM